MTNKQIEMILAVSESLNFTKAADALYVSQPTLTYQIKAAEDELRFRIFDRSQKNVSLTPSGKAFVESLRRIYTEYNQAVEQAQNYSENYSEDIVISLPYRSSIYRLPEAMQHMEKTHPGTLITPKFGWDNRLGRFLAGEVDILFDDYESLKNVKGIEITHFYMSRIYYVCNPSDSLANREIVRLEDLKDKVLMVGGGSQHQLRAVQERILNSLHLRFFNSNDHDTTLTNIAANKAIVLAPGFLHDRNDGFVWIPFDCHETIDCCLAIKESDKRRSVKAFIDLLVDIYSKEDPLSL